MYSYRHMIPRRNGETFLFYFTRQPVMNEERKCLRQMGHVRGHLWHRHSVTVNQVMLVTVNHSNFNLTNRNRCVQDTRVHDNYIKTWKWSLFSSLYCTNLMITYGVVEAELGKALTLTISVFKMRGVADHIYDIDKNEHERRPIRN